MLAGEDHPGYGRRGAELNGDRRQGQTLDHATLVWDKKWPFVRVECVDDQGRTAWSQGVLTIRDIPQAK